MTDLLRWGSDTSPIVDPSAPASVAGSSWLFEHRLPAAFGATAAIGFGAALWCGIGYLQYQQLAAGEQAAAIRAERANADLQDALARLRDQLGAARQSLNTAQSRLSSLNDDAQRQATVSEQALPPRPTESPN